jgi:hypothetical protein
MVARKGEQAVTPTAAVVGTAPLPKALDPDVTFTLSADQSSIRLVSTRRVNPLFAMLNAGTGDSDGDGDGTIAEDDDESGCLLPAVRLLSFVVLLLATPYILCVFLNYGNSSR